MDNVPDLFDDWARRGRAEGMEEGHSQTAGPLLEELPVEHATRFLDLGCGNGWAARNAAKRGASAVGVDASPEMVERAHVASEDFPDADWLHPVAGSTHFEVADFTRLPFADASFDMIWSMEALYYADVAATLHEARRVLDDDGQLHVLVDYYQENPASHAWPDDMGVSMTLLSMARWKQAARDAGFADVETTQRRSTDPLAEAWKREAGSLYLAARA